MRAVAYLTLLCVVAVVVLANVFPWALGGGTSGVAEFEIPRGASPSQVAGILHRAGLIANEEFFVALSVVLGLDKRIVAGKYVVAPRTDLVSLFRLLRGGQRHLNLVTVPEGLSLAEAVEVLAEKLSIEVRELERWATDPTLMAELGIDGKTAEGYMFPDTYDIPPGTGPKDVVTTMVKRALEVYSELRAKAPSPPALTRHEVFTLASIVEAEVTYEDEGPRVAAVFLNRLRKGMPLQADPTVAYALGGRKSRITYRDLEVDSPYNTYRYGGLPPGPICNPGEASIRAVLDPLRASKEMYFVARGDGRHVFSQTMAQHVEAKRKIRRERLGLRSRSQ